MNKTVFQWISYWQQLMGVGFKHKVWKQSQMRYSILRTQFTWRENICSKCYCTPYKWKRSKFKWKILFPLCLALLYKAYSGYSIWVEYNCHRVPNIILQLQTASIIPIFGIMLSLLPTFPPRLICLLLTDSCKRHLLRTQEQPGAKIQKSYLLQRDHFLKEEKQAASTVTTASQVWG